MLVLDLVCLTPAALLWEWAFSRQVLTGVPGALESSLSGFTRKGLGEIWPWVADWPRSVELTKTGTQSPDCL